MSDTKLVVRLTASDRATLQSEIGADQSAMTTLAGQVNSATTCAPIKTAATNMVDEYRIFYVMAPKTDLVVVADIESSIGAQLAGYDARITAAISAAQRAGKSVSAAQSAFTSLQSAESAADNQLNGLAANVIAQTPAGSPGNWQVFVDAHGQVVQARQDLVSAVTDLHAVVSDLR
jgi:hypothetical protein